MSTEFSFTKGSTKINIETHFGIRVLSVRGLNPPQPKPMFKREWVAENGIDYYLPTTRKIQSSEVTITVFCVDDDVITTNANTAIGKYRALCDYLIDGVVVKYSDNLQNQEVNLIYDSNKPSWYQFVDRKQIMSEITLINPTGTITQL